MCKGGDGVAGGRGNPAAWRGQLVLAAYDAGTAAAGRRICHCDSRSARELAVSAGGDGP